jgi:hypothetical protein
MLKSDLDGQHSGTVLEYSPHLLKVKGLSPAVAPGKQKVQQKGPANLRPESWISVCSARWKMHQGNLILIG